MNRAEINAALHFASVEQLIKALGNRMDVCVVIGRREETAGRHAVYLEALPGPDDARITTLMEYADAEWFGGNEPDEDIDGTDEGDSPDVPPSSDATQKEK